jgi:hypothetical protein
VVITSEKVSLPESEIGKNERKQYYKLLKIQWRSIPLMVVREKSERPGMSEYR